MQLRKRNVTSNKQEVKEDLIHSIKKKKTLSKRSIQQNVSKNENQEKPAKKVKTIKEDDVLKRKRELIDNDSSVISMSNFKNSNEVESKEDKKELFLKLETNNSIEKVAKQKDKPVCPPVKYESLGNGPCALPLTGKKYVGCHVSAAGGIWNCFENGRKCSAKSIALFLRNQRTWNTGKGIDEASVEMWNEAMKDYPLHLILPHGSYLMNLGSSKEENLEKSRQLLIEELKRCEKLGVPHYNFHPGSTLGKITREECCCLIAESINIAHKHTSNVICVIENMSKQGFTVGGDFHEIRLIIEGIEDKTRVGVCLDTCHAHAAGYDLASEKGFNKMTEDFEKIIGWQFLRGLHLNDSKGKVGDHKDRHETIGKGYIGLEGFKRIMNYPRFNNIPLILETPFVSEENYAKEIKLLESLITSG